MRPATPRWAVAAVAAVAAIGLCGTANADTTHTANTAGQHTETTLWDAAVGPRASYHVQGLTVLGDDTVLSFAEGRYGACDAGPRDIELRRSTDGGRTFAPTQIVVPTDGVRSFGNPTALTDSRTGTVFLFYNESFQLPDNTTCSGDLARVFYRTSHDDGRTWSDETDISDMFAGNPYGWTMHSPGPGHGIQLADGRLVVQVAHRRPIVGNTTAGRMYGLTDIYSDNHGRTWHQSAAVPVSTDYPINESRLIQRTDGSLEVNGRYAAGGTHYRISSVSTDRGRSWSAPVFDTATGAFTAIDAGFTRYSGGAHDRAPSRTLFSRPDATTRTNMTVSVSYDDGYSYSYSRVVDPGTAYYSDLARLSDGTIVLLYGRDGTSGSFPQRIVLARLTMSWVTNGADTGHGPAPLRGSTTEAGTRSAYASPGVAATVVRDANARGGRYLAASVATPGQYVDIPFRVTRAGTYQIGLRYRRTGDAAGFAPSIDGRPAGGVIDPAMTGTTAFQVYDLDGGRLSEGRHVLRVSATAAGVLYPDDLTLTANTRD